MSSQTFKAFSAALSVTAFAGSVSLLPSGASAAGSVPLADIRVFFKLDPRLSGPTYGGERWVAPPTYSTAADPIHLRAEGVDAMGGTKRISPKWTAADPRMVAISASAGGEAQISVKHAGDSTVQIAVDGVSRTLSIKSSRLQGTGVLQVEIASLAGRAQ
jgi:hypothetical protein